MLIDIIGWIGAFSSTIALLPQIIKTYKTGSAEDLSFFSIFSFLSAGIAWSVYGYHKAAWALVFTNVFITIFAVILLLLKWKLMKNKTKAALRNVSKTKTTSSK